MGYTIAIGQAEFTQPEDIGDDGSWSVEHVFLPDAPDFADSGRGNVRCPSYIVWSDFARATGIDHLFNDDKRGNPLHLIPTYPCVSRLTIDHVNEIDAALVRYQTAHPEAVPRCSVNLFGPHDDVGPNDADLMRLAWLAWWVRWAVANCEQPAIEVG